MMNEALAWRLLREAGVFYSNKFDPDEPDLNVSLNMNDVFGWAVGYGAEVHESEVVEVARLFMQYGMGGLYYWCTTLDQERAIAGSSFFDVQRRIDFVRYEESICKRVPNDSERAYYKVSYTLGPQEAPPPSGTRMQRAKRGFVIGIAALLGGCISATLPDGSRITSVGRNVGELSAHVMPCPDPYKDKLCFDITEKGVDATSGISAVAGSVAEGVARGMKP